MINNLKSERGSITIFVLASCLFFLISTVGVQAYTKNKQIAQETDYKQIKETYEKDIANQEAIYNKLKDVSKSGNITVSFESQDGYLIPTGGSSTDITQKFTIDNGTNKEIRQINYGWSNSNGIEPVEWISLPTNNFSYLVTKRGATEGDYYLWIKVVDEDANEEKIHMQSAITVYNQEITIARDGSNAAITYPSQVNMYNKKIGQGTNENEAKNSKVNNVNSSVNIILNYVYTEATDSHGNKIYKGVDFSSQDLPEKDANEIGITMVSESGSLIDVEFEKSEQAQTLSNEIISEIESYFPDDLNLYFEEKNSNIDIYDIFESSSSLELVEFEKIKVSGYSPVMNNVEMNIDLRVLGDEYAILIGIAEDVNDIVWSGYKAIENNESVKVEIPSNLMTLLNNSNKNIFVALIVGAE